jgi:CDP-glycerol glycerophosphotransferase (TagB/SpsB family)
MIKVFHFLTDQIVLIIADLYPKKNQLVIFGARHGVEYKDNTRHVYEYILENYQNISPIWMTHNDDVYHRLRSEGLPVAKIDSIRGYYLLLRANIAVNTHGPRDVSPIGEIPDSTTTIRLGHGRPVKYDDKFKLQNNLVDRMRKNRDRIDYVITTSEFMYESIPHVVEWPRDMYRVTGQPRNDSLFKPPKKAINDWNRFCDEFDFEIDNTILYAPTVRKPKYTDQTTTTEIFPFEDFNPDQLIDFLESHNGILLIRLHPWDMDQILGGSEHHTTIHEYDLLSEFIEDLSQHERICIADENTFADTNHLLPFVDILITDYSSIYHDFLLLDRPILFIPYDYETFKQDFGLIYDYFGNLPGSSINNFEEFIYELTTAIQNPQAYKDNRRELRDKVHTHQDAKSSKRVSELIANLAE